MKRHFKVITGAFMIVILTMIIFMPLRAQADPGTVTIHGQITYEPRDWNTLHIMNAGKEMEIDLYEKDHNGVETVITATNTNWNGEFTFTVTNYWGPSDPKLNIFYRVRLYYPKTDPPNPKTIVATPGSTDPYYFDSGTTYLATDGDWTINFAINATTSSNYQALWIFEDIRNAWDFVNTYDIRDGVHYDPGGVVSYWKNDSQYCHLGICSSYSTPDFIFIYNSNIMWMDVTVHETGHKFMANAGWWYPWPDCWTHYIFGINSNQCAWTEGWADFLALAVNSDPCYNFTPNKCGGTADQDYYNLEIHSRADDPAQFPWGDSVEGRIAATLYDLYDNENEGFDMISAGFSPISQLALGRPAYHPLIDFWYGWNQSSGEDYIKSGLTFWWNTIDYANIRQVFLPVVKR